MSTIKYNQVNHQRIAQQVRSSETESQSDSDNRNTQSPEKSQPVVRALKGDGVDELLEAQKVGKARVTVGKDGDGSAQTAAALGETAPLTMTAPSKKDLLRASQGAAPSWRPLTSFPMEVLEGLSFAIPIEMANTSGIVGGKHVEKGATPYVELSLEEILAFRRENPEAFKRLVKARGGDAVRVIGADGVEINPFSVELREEWANTQWSMTLADVELRGPMVESSHDPADEPQGDEAEGEDPREDAESEDAESDTQEIVLLSDEPLSVVPTMNSGLLAQLRSLHLADEDELRGAVLNSLSMGTSASALSSQTNGQLLSPTSGLMSFGAGEDLSGIPIEDLIFMFFMSITESSEEKLRDKMAEAAEQEALEAETGEYSGEGKSATTLASEVQMLMHEWRQLTEMTSNLMKTMHDMAMTPIRNLR